MLVVDGFFIGLGDGAVEREVSMALSSEAEDLWLREIFDFDDLLFVSEAVGMATLERLTSSILMLWVGMLV